MSTEHMSAEEYQRRFGSLARGPLARAEHKRSSPAPAATSKFGARSTVIDGIRFPSQREARRYTALQLLRASGEVLWFVRQPSFDLPGGTRYRADFLVVWRDGRVTVEDVKGFRTPAYVRSRKQVEALYPITIEEV